MHHCMKLLAPCAVLAILLCCLVSIKQRSPPVDTGSTSLTRTTAFMRVPLLRNGKSDGQGAATDAASPLLQAWREHCQQGFDCVRHPQPPSKAYLISLPIDVPKRVHTLRLLAELGLDVEVIDGIKSVQVGSLETYSECMPAGSAVDCQVGLTLSHMAVWKALASSGQPAAWVFECAPPSRLWLPGGSLDPRDDVVFHDDMLALFPSYWARVPANYQYIAVGQIPRHFNVSRDAVTVAPEVMPWGTHAYIISAQQAERMALTADYMIQRSRLPVDDFHTTTWQLDGEDIKIDHFLSVYYSELTPESDKRRWVVFDSPPEAAFKYGNVSWARNGGCQCSCKDLAACAAEGRAPAWGMGLVAQHTCREDVERVPVWWQEMQRLQAQGAVEPCAELRACGSFVCVYETLYKDEGEPASLLDDVGPAGFPNMTDI